MDTKAKSDALDAVEEAWNAFQFKQMEAAAARQDFIDSCRRAYQYATQSEIGERAKDASGQRLSRQRISQFLAE